MTNPEAERMVGLTNLSVAELLPDWPESLVIVPPKSLPGGMTPVALLFYRHDETIAWNRLISSLHDPKVYSLQHPHLPTPVELQALVILARFPQAISYNEATLMMPAVPVTSEQAQARLAEIAEKLKRQVKIEISRSQLSLAAKKMALDYLSLSDIGTPPDWILKLFKDTYDAVYGRLLQAEFLNKRLAETFG